MDNNERIVLVNLEDQIIGNETKAIVHKNGLLHRAFSIFILNEDKMLLQKRNINKYHSGGLWSNACCSHQRVNEDLMDAVYRRIYEELGFQCTMREIFTFVYRTEFLNGLIEYEIDHVFLGYYSGDVFPNRNEIENVKWEKIEKIQSILQNSPEKFSYWFREAFPRVMETVKNETNK